jgi:hypothetical protein
MPVGADVIETHAKFIGQRWGKDVRLAQHETSTEVAADVAAAGQNAKQRWLVRRLMPVTEARVRRVLGVDVPVQTRVPLRGVVARRAIEAVVVIEPSIVEVRLRKKIEGRQRRRVGCNTGNPSN